MNNLNVNRDEPNDISTNCYRNEFFMTHGHTVYSVLR